MSASAPVTIVPTGTANLASVVAGLRRVGAEPKLAAGADEVAQAPLLVLPGVGAFAAAVARLDDEDYRGALVERFAEGRPTLAICLGLQLLFEESEESPGARGLGLVSGAIRRLPDDLRLPQIGWNHIDPGPGEGLLEAGHAYFANSYACLEAPPGWRVAEAAYGVRFAAAFERGAWLACQFHPELSGSFGLALLGRWLARGREAAC